MLKMILGGLVRVLEDPHLRIREQEGQVVAIYEFSPAAEIRTFTVEVSAVADGQREKTPPIGADVPEPIGWEAENGTTQGGAMLTIGPDDPRKWAAVARAPADAVTRMTVKRVET